MRSLIGQPAVPFELPDIHGRIHKSSDDEGTWRLLVFHRHLG